MTRPGNPVGSTPGQQANPEREARRLIRVKRELERIQELNEDDKEGSEGLYPIAFFNTCRNSFDIFGKVCSIR